MKIKLLIIILLPFTSFAQDTYILQLEEPTISKTIKAISQGCEYTRNDTYIVNKDYVIYENCTTLKKLRPDMDSFYIPKDNFENYFALDKNTVYLRGQKIKTASKGFAIIGFSRENDEEEIYWKTENSVYRNRLKLTVYLDPSTLINLGSVEYGVYFKDKDNVYYKETKIENADPETIKYNYVGDFAYDKNNSYLKGKIITYNDEKIIYINSGYYKTTQHILALHDSVFVNIPKLDVNSFKFLGTEYLDCYTMDKNHVYFEGGDSLPIKKDNFKNIKVWDFYTRYYYLSDGKNVFFRGKMLKGIDGYTFGMLNDKNYFYDKNGIYENDFRRTGDEFKKLAFKYKKTIKGFNAFVDRTGNVIYENQACLGHYLEYYFESLSNEQVELVKKGELILLKGGNHIIIEKKTIQKEFDLDNLYKSNNKIYFNNTETIANANAFKRISDSIPFHIYGDLAKIYKDNKYVYWYKPLKGLFIIKGIDTKTTEVFNGFFKDKNYLYYYNRKMIKSKDLEMLGIYKDNRGYCGVGGSPETFNYYLFKNFEGYWLVELSSKVTIRNLGRRLKNNWKVKFKKNNNR